MIKTMIPREKLELVNMTSSRAKQIARKRGYCLYMRPNDSIRMFYIDKKKVRQKTWKQGSYRLI